MATHTKHKSEWDGISCRDCSNCGKTFVIHPGWVYRLRKKNRQYVYCSYTCFRKAQKRDITATVPERSVIHDKYTAEYDRAHNYNFSKKAK